MDYIKTFPNFPQAGVTFQWYSPLLKDPAAFKRVTQLFATRYRDQEVEAIVALDSRGFIFGSALAYELNIPLVLVRKAGKLPGAVVSAKYDLHYGKDCFEMENDVLLSGQKVIIVDDVIATGGTVKAAGQLVEQVGAQVYEAACLLEFQFLDGRKNIPYPVFSIVKVDGT